MGHALALPLHRLEEGGDQQFALPNSLTLLSHGAPPHQQRLAQHRTAERLAHGASPPNRRPRPSYVRKRTNSATELAKASPSSQRLGDFYVPIVDGDLPRMTRPRVSASIAEASSRSSRLLGLARGR